MASIGQKSKLTHYPVAGAGLRRHAAGLVHRKPIRRLTNVQRDFWALSQAATDGFTGFGANEYSLPAPRFAGHAALAMMASRSWARHLGGCDRSWSPSPARTATAE